MVEVAANTSLFRCPAARTSGLPSIFIPHQMRRNAAVSPQVRIRTSLRVLFRALPQNRCSILILSQARIYFHMFNTSSLPPKSSEFQPWVESPRFLRCTLGRYNVRRLRWTILPMNYCMDDASVRCFVSYHVWICPRFLAAH